MSKLIIQGGAELSGEIEVKGAKNSALKIIPAALLSAETVKITNLPNIEDVSKALNILIDLGAQVKKDKNDEVEINTAKINKAEINPDLAKKFRSSVMFVSPLLARFGEVKFPHPGGCVLGAAGRPIDQFLEGYRAMGAEIKENGNHYHIKAAKLKACEYFFTIMSVTATESMMMAAVLAEGTTTLKNCAMEPEITALAEYLNKQGAIIKGAGTPTMIIEGVKKINAQEFKVIPDRIETGSFAIMAAATKSEIKIKKCAPEHIRILLEIFKKIDIPFETGPDWIIVKKAKKIKPYNIKTHEYPGFPTDLQPPYTLLMTQAEGTSLIHETIYDRRLLFTDLLTQMGADITMCDPHRVVVNGPKKLTARKLASPDLRAGITLIIAALIARGQTEIDNIYQIDRGYENIDDRLRKLGAKIKRVGTLNF